MTKKEALARAGRIGADEGRSAAGWYWDRTDPQREDFLKVLKGIRDGDPEVLDTFMSGSLSGEWADDRTPKTLFDEIGITDRQAMLYGDELCDEYERAFNQVYSDSIEIECEEQLRETHIFHLEFELIEQDPEKVLSAMSDAAAKMDCSLVHEYHAVEGEYVEAGYS